VEFSEIPKIADLLFYHFYYYDFVNFYILYNNSKSLLFDKKFLIFKLYTF